MASGVTFVEGDRRGRFPFGNVLVLTGHSLRAVVDTGAGREVMASVAAAGPIHVVINTHYHIDHVSGNARLRGRSPAPEFWCPAGEREPLASWEGFLRFTGFDLPSLGDAGDVQALRQRLDWSPTVASRELADGDALDFGDLEARVLRLPGHTPGHTGLWFPGRAVVFAADIDLSTFGPWYGDVYASIDDYLASVRRLETLVDDLAGGGRRPVTVVTSHRRPLTYERFKERLPAFTARVAEREERILALLTANGPLSLEETAARWPVYGPQTRPLPGLYKSEYYMVKHHLYRLAKAGRVEAVTAGDDAGEDGSTGAARSGGKVLWRVR